jgi:NTE family protein
MMWRRPKTALVLAGGAARGAYEVGVVQHILEDVADDIGGDVPLDILSGTSVGAINAAVLAAHAERPRMRGAWLAAQWTSLKMSDLVHPGRGVFASIRGLFGVEAKTAGREPRRGGIIDPRGIEQLIQRCIPFEKIDANMRAGRLEALTFSATHVGSGRTTVFVQQRDRCPGHDPCDPTQLNSSTLLTAEHALASAAIPFLFPAVRIDGELYCDGGLRQNVPLAPALRLGAERLLIVSPRQLPEVTQTVVREQDFPGPFFLLGKAFNSLLLDRIDNDLDRLQAINALMAAGEASYGPHFTATINASLDRGRHLRQVRTTLIRASQDIGLLAAEYVRSPRFATRVRGIAGRIMRRIADASGQPDLLAYLLFDGDFAGQLIELGRADARARHNELCALFSDLVAERLAA